MTFAKGNDLLAARANNHLLSSSVQDIRRSEPVYPASFGITRPGEPIAINCIGSQAYCRCHELPSTAIMVSEFLLTSLR